MLGGGWVNFALECVTKMLLCFGWLQSAATSSSAKKVLNVPLKARLRAFFACILVAADFAHPRNEVHF